MCICFFEVCKTDDPHYIFKFGGNRDEFYNRPSLEMHQWEIPPPPPSSSSTAGVFEERVVIGGKDALRGGAWLAYSFRKDNASKSQKFAVVHNFRHADPVDTTKRSRGELVSEYLKSETSAEQYAKAIYKKGLEYLGFTLILVDFNSVYFVSNRGNEAGDLKCILRKLTPGIYGLCNSLLDTPWPKLVHGKRKFAKVLKRNAADLAKEEDLIEAIFNDVLCDATRFPSNIPGILEKDREIFLSSIFVEPYVWDRSGFYGTRMQSIIFIKKNGNFTLRERSLDTDSPIKNWIGRFNEKSFIKSNL